MGVEEAGHSPVFMRGPGRGLERARKHGLARSTMIAYGGWGLLTLLLLLGTMTTLGQSESTQRAAVLDRADASAAELEQSVLRVFDQVAMLQSLAQTRSQMVEDGNTAGLSAIEEQIASIGPPDRFGILHVAVTGPDGVSAPARRARSIWPISEPAGGAGHAFAPADPRPADDPAAPPGSL